MPLEEGSTAAAGASVCLAFALMMVLQAVPNRDKDHVRLPSASPSPWSDNVSSYNIIKHSSAITVQLGGEPANSLSNCPFSEAQALL